MLGRISTGGTFTLLSVTPFSIVLDTILTSWLLWNCGVPFYAASTSFCNVTIKTACLSSISAMQAFPACTSVCVKPMIFTFDHEWHLSRSDINFTASSCLLHIKWSKTRQHREGLHIVPLPSIPQSSLSHVTAICHYFHLVPASPHVPFFCHPKATHLAPVMESFFTTSLKHPISSIGITLAYYSPHSFRQGGATYAFQVGVPEHLLQLHGDWHSDTYLTLPLETHTTVADIMAAGLYRQLRWMYFSLTLI